VDEVVEGGCSTKLTAIWIETTPRFTAFMETKGMVASVVTVEAK
jgi:hypothetical protein